MLLKNHVPSHFDYAIKGEKNKSWGQNWIFQNLEVQVIKEIINCLKKSGGKKHMLEVIVCEIFFVNKPLDVC